MTMLIFICATIAGERHCEEIDFGRSQHCQAYGALRVSYFERGLRARGWVGDVAFICKDAEVMG